MNLSNYKTQTKMEEYREFSKNYSSLKVKTAESNKYFVATLYVLVSTVNLNLRWLVNIE